MPQFDFYTAFNQIFFGSLGFFTLFWLLTFSRSSSYLLNILINEKNLNNFSLISHFSSSFRKMFQINLDAKNGSSYLESFHIMFIARKVKFFLVNRFSSIIIRYSYLTFLQNFILISNKVSKLCASLVFWFSTYYLKFIPKEVMALALATFFENFKTFEQKVKRLG